MFHAENLINIWWTITKRHSIRKQYKKQISGLSLKNMLKIQKNEPLIILLKYYLKYFIQQQLNCKLNIHWPLEKYPDIKMIEPKIRKKNKMEKNMIKSYKKQSVFIIYSTID